MRVLTWFGALLSVAALTRAVELAVEDEAIVEDGPDSGEFAGEPEILAIASFPEENAFGHIINGERNTLTVAVENNSKQNVTLMGVAGHLLNVQTDAVIANLSSFPYGFPLYEGVKLNLPYSFHSEYKTGDVHLQIWLEHIANNVQYRVVAFDGVVTIVEPPLSIFDLKMISTWLIVFGFLGGLGYVGYLTFAPAPKTRGRRTIPATETPTTATATTTGTATYDEDWIPEHHLRKTKGGKKQKQSGATSATSGDETSGAEASGTEGKRRKGKK